MPIANIPQLQRKPFEIVAHDISSVTRLLRSAATFTNAPADALRVSRRVASIQFSFISFTAAIIEFRIGIEFRMSWAILVAMDGGGDERRTIDWCKIG